MIRALMGRISEFLRKGEHIILPPEVQEKKKKSVRVAIFYLKSVEDLTKVRAKLADHPLIFLNVTGVKGDLKSIVDRLKLMGEQFSHRVYGLDPRWLLLTKYEVGGQ